MVTSMKMPCDTKRLEGVDPSAARTDDHAVLKTGTATGPHILQEERPEQFNRLQRAFLEERPVESVWATSPWISSSASLDVDGAVGGGEALREIGGKLLEARLRLVGVADVEDLEVPDTIAISDQDTEKDVLVRAGVA